MSKEKNTATSIEPSKNEIKPRLPYDLILLFLILSGGWLFGEMMIKNPKFISLSESFKNLPDYISILPAFSGGLFITALFLYRGKSIKSLNDCVLFSTSAYALYLFLFDTSLYDKTKNITEVLVDPLLFYSKISILICTIGKTIITFSEFITEWTKEDAESRKKKDIKNEDNQRNIPIKIIDQTTAGLLEKKTVISPIMLEGNPVTPIIALDSFPKNELDNLSFDYAIEHSKDGMVLHEKISVSLSNKKNKSISGESITSHSNKYGKVNNILSILYVPPSKKSIIVSLVTIAILLSASPFIYVVIHR
ncbi:MULTISPECIES: hypothetical protein [Pantoea]|uniref:Uncharacterized protein n=1 Tax=Candidatus Pantoea floridensis TaxID=1938870 RepID=A0A286BW25_9GAMM|nr:hypothetical protein [Pantoea floridensis]PIF20837.1 hypothetical protein BX596_0193 [Enterobacteriaceae bacterium JKS000233]SOD38353.1 hypothetical protein SAMN06273570_2752 [Pantoea floridensis]